MVRSIGVLAAFVANLVAFHAMADEPRASTAVTDSNANSFLVHEDHWNAMVDEPGQQLGMARESYLTVDLGAAAKRLRKAAAHLRITSSQADEKTRAQLNQSADELDSLAHSVETGKVKSAHELDRPSARALQRLSRHHYLMAQRSWVQKQRERTGKQLRAAADDLEHAARLSEQEVEAATKTVVADVRVISTRLVDGVASGVDDVGAGLERFGKQIESVGHRMESTQKTALQSK